MKILRTPQDCKYFYDEVNKNFRKSHPEVTCSDDDLIFNKEYKSLLQELFAMDHRNKKTL